MSEIKNLQREVKDIKAKAGVEDGKLGWKLRREAEDVIFQAFYRLRGHGEIHEVQGRFIEAAKAKDETAFIWRWTEEEFGMIAYTMLKHVYSTVMNDVPTREAADAELRKLKNPYRAVDICKEYPT